MILADWNKGTTELKGPGTSLIEDVLIDETCEQLWAVYPTYFTLTNYDEASLYK